MPIEMGKVCFTHPTGKPYPARIETGRVRATHRWITIGNRTYRCVSHTLPGYLLTRNGVEIGFLMTAMN